MRDEPASVHGDAPLRETPWIYWGVVALSLLLVEETLADARDPWFYAFGWWLVALAIGLSLRQVSKSLVRLAPTPILMSLLAIGFVAPFIQTAWSASLGTTSLPMELQFLSSLRNTILLLSVIPKGNHLHPLVVVATVFIAICAAAQSDYPLLLTTIAVWGALAAIWMASTLTAGGREKPPFPVSAVSFIVISFLLLSGWHATLPSGGGSVLAEWLNSSGGSTKHSSDARSGVGDGDASANDGEKPESDGGVGKKFVESHERSFYDALTEVYGERYKPKDMQRAVPLPMELLVGHQRSKSHQASREFALNRKTPKRRLALKDRAATALLYVTGPTPIHLRLRTYAIFDGDVWHDVDESEAHSEIQVDGERWLQMGSLVDRISAEPVTHTIRVGGYSDRMVPLPTLARAFRIGLVNRGDFFIQPSAEVIWLSGEHAKVVGGEVIESHSDTLYENQITSDLMASASPDHLYRWLPDDPRLRATLAETVRSWTDASNDQWRKAQAIIQRLRADFVHESIGEGSIPASSDIGEFLSQTHRGPDYMFATAAALLLRELGCSTRLALGYYAGPEHFDAWSRSTPIQSTQLHTWAEVLVAGRWVPVEPTPGYTLLVPRWTWFTAIQTLARDVSEIILQRPAIAIATALSIIALIRCRSILLDTIYTLVCLAALWGRREGGLQWTRWLLDRRLRLAGRPRPASLSLRRWLETETRAAGTSAISLRRFLARFDSATYGQRPPEGEAEDAKVCSAVIKQWTTTRLRGQPQKQAARKLRLGKWLKSAFSRPEAFADA